MVALSIVIIYLTIFTRYSLAQKVFLSIPDGEIMGSVESTVTNTFYYSFKGIPYAQPPINELRFQASKPIAPWSDTLDATHEKSICFQVPVDDDDENEDCLYLNVFIPRDTSSTSPLPVMVFFHGGSFIQGSGKFSEYGPQHFMDYDVIIVTFNYRLGPFGFFSTGDSAIPGNAGLKDQYLALHWVQKNIQYFGGDSQKVTIFGQDAGAASVAYHILSPKSKGLFRAAICGSGSALNPWAFQRNQAQNTFKTVAIIDPSFDGNKSSSELRDFILSLTSSEIDKAAYELNKKESPDNIQLHQGVYYGPVIEHDHDDAFITQEMYEDFKIGNFNIVPLVIGITSYEALDFFDDAKFNDIARAFDQDLSLLVPKDLHIKDDDIREQIGKIVKDAYSPNHSFEGNLFNVIELLNDNSFLRGTRKHIEFQSNLTDVYFYRFSYSGRLGGRESRSVEGFSYRVRHGEDLGYLFVRNYGNFNTTDLSEFPEMDRIVHRRLVTMFTNFAKTLNPTPEQSDVLENIIWPTLNSNNFNYLDIGSSLGIKTSLRERTYDIWEDIFSKYGVPPFDTY